MRGKEKKSGREDKDHQGETSGDELVEKGEYWKTKKGEELGRVALHRELLDERKSDEDQECISAPLHLLFTTDPHLPLLYTSAPLLPITEVALGRPRPRNVGCRPRCDLRAGEIHHKLKVEVNVELLREETEEETRDLEPLDLRQVPRYDVQPRPRAEPL